MSAANQTPERLFLIDGSSFVFRGFHALPDLRSKDGEPTGAVYGFINMFQSLLDEYRPEAVVVTFDRPEPTFRHDLFEQYKSERVAPPEELTAQLPVIKEILSAMGVTAVEQPGVEADDLIATLCRQARQKGLEVVVVTGDKDLLQLAGPGVKVLQSHFQNSKLYSEEDVRERFGCSPEALADYFGLMGDKIDGIPGVPGIGGKSAKKLLQQFGNLDKLYESIDSIRGKQREKLEQNKQQALLSRELARLKEDVDLQFEWKEIYQGEVDLNRLRNLYRRLGFRTLLKKLPGVEEEPLIEGSYLTVDTREKLKKVCEAIRNGTGAFAIDTETSGLDTQKEFLVGIAISFTEGEAFYLPIKHRDGTNLPIEDVIELLGPCLKDPSLGKIGHHLKFDIAFLKKSGLPFEGVAFDTLVASQLVEPGRDTRKLDALALDHLGNRMTPIEALIGTGKNQCSISEIPIERVTNYAGEDVDATLRLEEHYRPAISDHGLDQLYYSVELPLISVLQEMEQNGVYVDREELSVQSAELAKRQADVESRIHELAGEVFNVGSPKQLAEILFDRMKLPSRRKRSTAVAVLEKLASDGYEIAEEVIRYRQLTKLKSTYLDALPGMIDPVTGRVHTSYQQNGAATGRISSSEPNLQNIPIRTEDGKRIRKAFKAPSGSLLMSADYSQVELRILAHLADDPGLIDAFQRGEDIHSFTAREIFSVPEGEEVTSEQRRKAKAINFGLNYGMTPYGLAERLQIQPEEAKDYMGRYFARYPRVLEFVEETKSTANKNGYVKTLMGRMIPTPAVSSSNYLQREAAERAAINAPVQGSAADLLKKAMVAVNCELKKHSLDSLMILTVHDEIVLEVPQAECDTVSDLLQKTMEECERLKVPLKVDLASGSSWADL